VYQHLLGSLDKGITCSFIERLLITMNPWYGPPNAAGGPPTHPRYHPYAVYPPQGPPEQYANYQIGYPTPPQLPPGYYRGDPRSQAPAGDYRPGSVPPSLGYGPPMMNPGGYPMNGSPMGPPPQNPSSYGAPSAMHRPYYAQASSSVSGVEAEHRSVPVGVPRDLATVEQTAQSRSASERQGFKQDAPNVAQSLLKDELNEVDARKSAGKGDISLEGSKVNAEGSEKVSLASPIIRRVENRTTSDRNLEIYQIEEEAREKSSLGPVNPSVPLSSSAAAAAKAKMETPMASNGDHVLEKANARINSDARAGHKADATKGVVQGESQDPNVEGGQSSASKTKAPTSKAPSFQFEKIFPKRESPSSNPEAAGLVVHKSERDSKHSVAMDIDDEVDSSNGVIKRKSSVATANELDSKKSDPASHLTSPATASRVAQRARSGQANAGGITSPSHQNDGAERQQTGSSTQGKSAESIDKRGTRRSSTDSGVKTADVSPYADIDANHEREAERSEEKNISKLSRRKRKSSEVSEREEEQDDGEQTSPIQGNPRAEDLMSDGDARVLRSSVFTPMEPAVVQIGDTREVAKGKDSPGESKKQRNLSDGASPEEKEHIENFVNIHGTSLEGRRVLILKENTKKERNWRPALLGEALLDEKGVTKYNVAYETGDTEVVKLSDYLDIIFLESSHE